MRPIRLILLCLASCLASANAQTTIPLPVTPRPPVTPKPLALPRPVVPPTPPKSLVLPKPAVPPRRPHVRAYQPPFNPDVILIDPAHGGADSGGILGSDGEEKEFNLAFAHRLEELLAAKGFTVLLTHQDTDKDMPADQRVEMANRSKAVACLLIHASNAGHGVHLFNSALTEPANADQGASDGYLAPWDSAQAGSLARSLQLTNELATALNAQRIPLVVARASVSPIDSLVCPSVAIEIAPPASRKNIGNDAYQQQIANSLVTALSFWRQRAESLIAGEQAAALAANPEAAAAPKAKVKPKPVVIESPDEVPLAPDAPTKAAPIVRRSPPSTPPGGAR